MGGTLVSALAGEYSFSFALAFGLFALGALAYSVRSGRRVWLAALLLAATVLSHVVVGIFVGVGRDRHRRGCLDSPIPMAVGRRRRAHRARGGAADRVLDGPAARDVPDTRQNMRYTKIVTYLAYLLVDEFTWIYVLAIVGLALSIAFRDRAGITVALMAGVWALVFRFWPELHAWNLRFLPFWYLDGVPARGGRGRRGRPATEQRVRPALDRTGARSDRGLRVPRSTRTTDLPTRDQRVDARGRSLL